MPHSVVHSVRMQRRTVIQMQCTPCFLCLITHSFQCINATLRHVAGWKGAGCRCHLPQ